MSSATEATRKAIYLSHFTPSMMPAEALESMLVQREPLLKTAVESIIQSVTTGSRHHQLFVGPRGIGKTHLISLIHHRISQNKEVTDKALIAWMREEEWGVTSFFELVMRILRNLNLAYPALEIDKQTQPLYDLKLKDAEVRASEILATHIKEKVLIILMENLDDLFEQLGDAGQKQWRAFIQNHPQFVLVTTTPSLFSGVSAQKSVFYGFFDITQLDEFSFDEVSELLKKIAEYREDAELVSYLATAEGRARVRAVHHLAEGNPRIYIIFSQFLSKVALDELVQAFMHTLDELTPYYQARMKELSGQQRKILEFLIRNRNASTVRDIAKACFLTSQTCSSQLKQLREKRYLSSIQSGRESYYELREPLMRLCMSVKTERSEPISLFVEMLRIWYSEDDLLKKLRENQNHNKQLTLYLLKALELNKEDAVEPHVLIAIKNLKEKFEKKPDATITAIQEFTNLSSKSAVVQGIQITLKICIDEADEEEITVGMSKIQGLVSLMHSSKEGLDGNNFLVAMLVFASFRLEEKSKQLNKVLLKSILRLIEINPASMAVFVLAATDVRSLKKFNNWLKAMTSIVSETPTTKKTIVFANKCLRMMTALHDVATGTGNTRLLALPREERALVERMTQQLSPSIMEKKEPS